MGNPLGSFSVVHKGDLNEYTSQGIYDVLFSAKNSPLNSPSVGVLFVIANRANQIIQLAFIFQGGVYERMRSSSGSWSDWIPLS